MKHNLRFRRQGALERRKKDVGKYAAMLDNNPKDKTVRRKLKVARADVAKRTILYKREGTRYDKLRLRYYFLSL